MATEKQIARIARLVATGRPARDLGQIRAIAAQRFIRPTKRTRGLAVVERHIAALAAGEPTTSPAKRRLGGFRPSGRPFNRQA